MTLETLIRQFRRNSEAYKEQGLTSEAQCWSIAAGLLEEYVDIQDAKEVIV